MEENSKEHITFKISEELVNQVEELISNDERSEVLDLLDQYHYADIAEILEELNFEQAVYVIKLLDSEKTSDILSEIDEDIREKILENLSEQEIAQELEELDTDDAVDIIAELPEDRQQVVLDEIKDEELKADIEELLTYDEYSAGGLMATELVKVNENWSVTECVREMRIQAAEVTRVHSIYVVDNDGRLIGRLSLKDLLIAPDAERIANVYIPRVDYVHVDEQAEDVARLMQKYDLEAIPVVDDDKVLKGRITIDDIVDVIKEEAEKDYQMAAGFTQVVEVSDTILELTRARLPWLFLGLMGGIGAALIMGDFEAMLENHAVLFFFTPLIAAMAGNVGVQSSAIIVQGLANDDVKGSINKRLLKEMLLAALNGLILAMFLLLFVWAWEKSIYTALAISVSLIVVIIVAGLIGTFVPLFLDKRGIDPAIATGPFITTSNDIFGILIYFWIAKVILQI